MKILIIEDESAIREEILDMLIFEGHEVFEAVNGRDGIALAMQQIPDLIISDITMPEMDGYGVLMELKDHPKLKSVPFIFLTARADRSFVRHGMELGADDYVGNRSRAPNCWQPSTRVCRATRPSRRGIVLRWMS